MLYIKDDKLGLVRASWQSVLSRLNFNLNTFTFLISNDVSYESLSLLRSLGLRSKLGIKVLSYSRSNNPPRNIHFGGLLNSVSDLITNPFSHPQGCFLFSTNIKIESALINIKLRLKLINENRAAAATYGPVSTGTTVQTGQPVQTGQYAQYVSSPVDQAKLLTGEISQIDNKKGLPTTLVQDEKSRLDKELERLSRSDQAALFMAEGKKIMDKNEVARKDILRQKAELSVITSSKDLAELEGSFVPALRPALTTLRAQMADGLLTPSESQKAIADLQKANFEYQVKQQDYTNESIRVAKSLFPTKPINELTGPELGKVQARLQLEAERRSKAGASNINVGEKSFGTAFGKGVAESVEGTFAAAQGAQSTLGTIQSIRPIIRAGVYSGPLSAVPRVINQLASSLGVTGTNDDEKLKNTAVVMQGLASLEMSAAQAMKNQGAITENERALIKRASAGDLQTFTQGEVLSLLNAMEKTSKFKIKAHEKNLQRLRSRPDTAELADFYSLESMAAEGAPAQSLSEAAKAEQERRKAAKGGQ